MSLLRNTALALAASTLAGGTAIAAHGAGPSTSQRAVHPCSATRATVGSGDGTAGSVYYPITLKNVSGVTCTLDGYPVVSFTNRFHDPLGGQAAETPQTHGLVTLAVGASAHATVQVPDPGNFSAGACRAAATTYLRVRTKVAQNATFVPLATRVCTTTRGQSFVLPIH